MKTTVHTLAIAVLGFTSVGASPLDDVVAYYRGGSGNAVSGSMPDLAHRTVANNPWSAGDYYSSSSANETIRFENDRIPLLTRYNGSIAEVDTWLEDEPCLCVEPLMTTNAQGTVTQTKSARWQLGHPAEYSKNWTGFSFVMRYKPLDPGLNRARTKPAWVFCAGTDWKTEGFCIKEVANTARTGASLVVGTTSALKASDGWAYWNVTYGNWYEFAVCGDDTNKKLLVGFRDLQGHGLNAEWQWKEMDYPENFLRLSGTGANYELALGMDDIERAWRGHVHMLGIWSRKLAKSEIIDIFRDDIPHSKLIELGCLGASAYAFAGDGSSDIEMTKADAYHWNMLPSSFCKGKKVTIPFEVRDWQKNLGQVLKLTPAADSSFASVSVSVDGKLVDTLTVSTRKASSLYLPAELFTVGAHTLTLERTDGGAGALKIDRIRLGGSWQMGRANDSRDEFASPGGKHYDYLGEFSNWAGAVRMFSTHYTDSTPGLVESIHCHFTIDPDLVSNKYCYRFRVKGGGTLGLRLNDAETVTYKLPSTSWSVVEHKFKPGELVAGENVLSFIDLTPQSEASATATWHHMDIDYQTLEIGRERGGMILIFR